MSVKELTEEEIVAKIQKLLSLADKAKNTSESEAQLALLKAQELMAKYDIEVDSTSTEEHEIIAEACNHKWDMGYRKPLGTVIANNFKCKMYLHGKYVTFFGHKNDARVAREVFEYAYNYAYREGNRQYNLAYTMGKNTKGVFNSYALGFIRGIEEKLGEQSVALMIVTPPDVNDKFEEMTAGWKTAKSKMDVVDREAFMQGKQDGRHILDRRQLEA